MYSQDAERTYSINEISTFPNFKEIKCTNPNNLECFKFQINEHIRRNFRYPMEAKLSGKVYIQFTIDPFGNTVDIRARGSHNIFEKAGIEIIEKIKDLEPATIDGKAIALTYSLPITFKGINPGEIFEDTEESHAIQPYNEVHEAPLYEGCQGAKNKSACFQEKLNRDITDFVHRSIKNIPDHSVKIYFEIKTDLTISDLVIITSNKHTKKSYETFFDSPLKIIAPAKDGNGDNITTYYTTDLKSISREVRQR
ncbi:energy transducer TonB [Sediminicola sp. 1XM1-17]|uniref:energy transducer TonB n=1 Tax=Sediminicola sp. 1XM1-17 TaxID=3127702 RepID=UPI003077C409